MSLAENLRQSEQTLEAMLTYANGVTGKTDVSIGDAIKSLADGYGGEGGGFRKIGEFVTTENVFDCHYFTEEISYPCVIYLEFETEQAFPATSGLWAGLNLTEGQHAGSSGNAVFSFGTGVTTNGGKYRAITLFEKTYAYGVGANCNDAGGNQMKKTVKGTKAESIKFAMQNNTYQFPAGITIKAYGIELNI